MKILVVDDDIDIRRLIHYALERLGRMEVILAEGGEEALELALDETPDVILLDVMMPGMDGVETFHRIRREPTLSGIPIIFLTAKRSSAELRKLQKLGAKGIITKPFDVAALADQVNALANDLAIQTAHRDLDELRSVYRRGTRERLQRIRSLLEEIAKDPANFDLITALLVQFNQLGGSGSSYGFPHVSALATRGERDCEVFLREMFTPSPEDVQRWRELVDAISDDLNRVTEPAGEGEEAATDLLVVSQREDVPFLVSQRLEAGDFIVRSARTFESGLMEIGRKIPGALIVSYPLPDGPAHGLIEQLRIAPGGSNATAIVVAQGVDFLEKIEAIRAGADDVFEEPLDWERIAARVEQLVANRRNRAAKILVVEDDEMELDRIGGALQSAGYEVSTLTEPEKFSIALAAFKPDLVITDQEFSSLNGFELARYLRMQPDHVTTPLIFLGASLDDTARRRSVEAGVDDILGKPVSTSLLLSLVATRVERARFTKALLEQDGLTRVSSHSAFLRRAKELIGEKHRNPSKPSMLVEIAIDNVDEVNETHGPLAGDQLLVWIATMLRQRLRQSDVIGRISGTTFGVLLDSLDEDTGIVLMMRVLDDLATRPLPSRPNVTAMLHAGLALLHPSLSVRSWMKEANQALQEARASDRKLACRRHDEEEGASALTGF